MAGVPQASSQSLRSELSHPQHQPHHGVASRTHVQGQCLYNDPSVFVKTEYDQGKNIHTTNVIPDKSGFKTHFIFHKRLFNLQFKKK